MRAALQAACAELQRRFDGSAEIKRLELELAAANEELLERKASEAFNGAQIQFLELLARAENGDRL